MPPRRSHPKSRRGCQTCKKRRVKCDEKGPPCGACAVRKTPCSYANLPEPATNAVVTLQNDEASTLDTFQEARDEKIAFPSCRRLLELQLMHRWSLVTYKSMCTKAAEDDYIWHTKVPEMSVQYDFLLNGLLALSAFERASSSNPFDEKYVSAGIEYHTLALSSFRNQLQDISPTGFEAILCFSLMLMVLALGSAQFAKDFEHGDNGSMVQNTIVHYELLRGCATVMESNQQYIEESPYIRKLKRFEDLPRKALDDSTQDILAQLSDANDQRIKSSTHESYELRVKHVFYWEACKKAIFFLQECFAKCIDIDSHGYVLGWLNMAGDDYIQTIKADDNIALLTLVCWAVLVDRLDSQVWWAKNYGSLLVKELATRKLSQSADTVVEDVLSWAHKLVQITNDNHVEA